MENKFLRILVILPMYGGSLPVGIYCARALRELGYSVRMFDAQELFPAYKGIKKLDLSQERIAVLENSFLKFVSQAIWSQIQEQQPEMILALAQAPVDRPLLQRLRQAGIRTIMWFVEDYKIFNYWRIYAPLYDAFAVIQKEPFTSLLKKSGQPNVLYLPLAADPGFHKQLKLSENEKKLYGADISFMGAGYPNRRLAFRPLAGRNFKIWGSDWEDETILKDNIQKQGKRIEADETVKIYNASRINLNLHSSLGTESLVSNGDFVNPRTFELAASGAFQLVDKRSLLGELFAEDELATFSTIDEFYEKIDYFLDKPEERQKYIDKARERVLREHTYQKRMEKVVSYMERTFGPFSGEKQNKESFPDLNPEIKARLMDLMGRLGLSPQASFQDVVARLRQQSGKLDEIETAILFLDEWNKQYKK